MTRLKLHSTVWYAIHTGTQNPVWCSAYLLNAILTQRGMEHGTGATARSWVMLQLRPELGSYMQKRKDRTTVLWRIKGKPCPSYLTPWSPRQNNMRLQNVHQWVSRGFRLSGTWTHSRGRWSHGGSVWAGISGSQLLVHTRLSLLLLLLVTAKRPNLGTPSLLKS